MSWDGSVNGVLVNTAPFGLASQSPDGRYVVLGGMLYDRHGKPLGAYPWSTKDFRTTWSPDSGLMCKVPDLGISGGPLRLEVAAVGQRPRMVAQGFGTFHDQSGFPVLACDLKTDRAVVAEFSQGFMPMQAWLIKMSTGTVVGTLGPSSSPTAASPDGSLFASSTSGGATPRTTILAADGTVLATIPGFTAQGFSGDSTLLLGEDARHATVVLNWRAGQRVWSSSAAPFFGFIAEPHGSHLVVALAAANGNVGHAYLIGRGGAVAQFPPGIAAGWQ